MKFIAFFLLLAAIITPKAQAIEFFVNDTVTISQDRVVDDSVFVSGETIRIDGEIFGDVFCVGRDVTITGAVHGDIICAGQDLRLNNVTDGDARVVGQMVDINGTVGNNVTSLGQTVTISDSGWINGEWVVAAQTARMQGIVGRNMQGWAQSVELTGDVDKNISVDTESLHIGGDASIGGNLTYTSDQDAAVAEGASISGTVSRKTPPVVESKSKSKLSPPMPMASAGIRGGLFVVTTLLLGALLIMVFPKYVTGTTITMRERGMETFIRGIVTMMVIPFVLLLLIVTLIGIPVAFVIGSGLVIAYFVGRILTTILIGQLILENLYKKKKDSLGWSVVVGAILLWAVFSLPVIGGIASFLVTLFGFGSVTYVFSHSKTAKK